MLRSSRINARSFEKRIAAAARRCTGIAIAAAVLLLSAPFVTTRHEEILPPPPPAPVAAESRVPVKLRHGDTLITVLKRFGVGPPSAHALIEKMRRFVNLRKIQTGDDLHVVLNAADRSVEAKVSGDIHI